MKKGDKVTYNYPRGIVVDAVIAYHDGKEHMILEMDIEGLDQEVGWAAEGTSELIGYVPVFKKSSYWNVYEGDIDVIPYSEPSVNNSYSII